MMNDILLTSPGFIKVVTPLSDNCNEKTLNFAIREAQIYQLQQILGTKLYNKLKDLISNDEIGNEENKYYKDLLDHCQYFIAYTVITEVIVPLTYKIDNFGTGTTTDEHVQSLGINDVFQLKDYYTKKVDFYREQLQHYLLNNYKKLPEIDRCQVNAISSHLNTSATTSIFLGGARAKNSICRHETSIALEPVEFIWAGAQANDQVVDIENGSVTLTLTGYLFVRYEDNTYAPVNWNDVTFETNNEIATVSGNKITFAQSVEKGSVIVKAKYQDVEAEDYATFTLNEKDEIVEYLFIGVNNYSGVDKTMKENGLKVYGNVYAVWKYGKYEKIEWRNVDIDFTNPDLAYAAELKDDGFIVKLTEQYSTGNIEINFSVHEGGTVEKPVEGNVNIEVEEYFEIQLEKINWIGAELNNGYTSIDDLYYGYRSPIKGTILATYNDGSSEIIDFQDCELTTDFEFIEARVENGDLCLRRTGITPEDYNVFCSYQGHQAEEHAHFIVGEKPEPGPEPEEKTIVSARWRFVGRFGIGEAKVTAVRNGNYQVPGILEVTYNDGSIGILSADEAQWTNANASDGRLYFHVPDAHPNQSYDINGTIYGVRIDTITITVAYDDYIKLGFKTKPTQEKEFTPSMVNIWNNDGEFYQRSQCGHIGNDICLYTIDSIAFPYTYDRTLQYFFIDISDIPGRTFNQLRFYAALCPYKNENGTTDSFDLYYDFYVLDYDNNLMGTLKNKNVVKQGWDWPEIVIDLDPQINKGDWVAYKLLAKPSANQDDAINSGQSRWPQLFLALNCPSLVNNPDAGQPNIEHIDNMEQFTDHYYNTRSDRYIITDCDTRIVFSNRLNEKKSYSFGNVMNNEVQAYTGRGRATLGQGYDWNTYVYPSKLANYRGYWMIWGANDNPELTDSDDSIDIIWNSVQVEEDYYGLSIVAYPFTHYGVPFNGRNLGGLNLNIYGTDVDAPDWNTATDRKWGYDLNNGELKEVTFKFEKPLHITPDTDYHITFRTYGLKRADQYGAFGETRLVIGLKEVAFLTKEQMKNRGYTYDDEGGLSTRPGGYDPDSPIL